MKTNVPIDLTDAQRSELANMLDGKVTQRLATRKEIVKLCEDYIAELVSSTEGPVERPAKYPRAISRDEADHLAGKSEGYIRGWNMVKNRNR